MGSRSVLTGAPDPRFGGNIAADRVVVIDPADPVDPQGRPAQGFASTVGS